MGPKGDNKFVKELVIACFGHEVLAASSIDGTAKGGRKKIPSLLGRRSVLSIKLF